MYEDTKTTGEQTINFLQMVPMTFEEKVAMYMKCSKLELAKMLLKLRYFYKWLNLSKVNQMVTPGSF